MREGCLLGALDTVSERVRLWRRSLAVVERVSVVEVDGLVPLLE